MAIKITFYSLLILFSSSCSSPSEKKTETPPIADTSKTGGFSTNTLSAFNVKEPSIVFLWPDSLQMEQLKVKDSDAFYTGADDYSFYNYTITEIADTLNIKTFSTNARIINFITNKNTSIKITKSGLEESWWGVYLFDGTNPPKLQPTLDITKEFLKNYFKK